MKVQSVFRIALPRYILRVYKNEESDFEYVFQGYTELEIEAHRNQDLPMMELARKILAMQQVTAVEIIGWENNGVRVEK